LSPSKAELEDEGRLYYKGYVRKKAEVKGSKSTSKSWASLLMVLQGKELLFFKERKGAVRATFISLIGATQ